MVRHILCVSEDSDVEDEKSSRFNLVARGIAHNKPLASDYRLNTTEDLRHENVTLPPSTPDRSCLAVMQTLTFSEEELGAVVLVFYDDSQTLWQIDSIELYDFEDRNHNAIDVWVIRIKEAAIHHYPASAESVEPGLRPTSYPRNHNARSSRCAIGADCHHKTPAPPRRALPRKM